MNQVDLKQQAMACAAALSETYDSPGWKVFMSQLSAEIEYAKDCALESVSSDTTDKVAMEFQYRRGIHDGMRAVLTMRSDLLEALKDGRVPWLERREAIRNEYTA